MLQGGGIRPGEEVSDGPHRDNRGGVAHTATPLGPQAEVELPGYRAPALRFAPVLCCRVFLMYVPSALRGFIHKTKMGGGA